MHGLVIQPLCCVQGACSRVQAELPQAEGIRAAQECKGQFVLLVPVAGADLQDLRPWRFVLSHVHFIELLGELRPVVVGVDDADEHLQKTINTHFIQRELFHTATMEIHRD